MQLPTCTGIRIRTLSDAHVIFHAVSLGLLPIVSRRLDIEERRFIHSGCVCVWEERSACGESSSVSPSAPVEASPSLQARLQSSHTSCSPANSIGCRYRTVDRWEAMGPF